MRAALDHALAGHDRLLLISGEPGIGKSRLADELIGHARRRVASVLVGRCWEAGGAPAYWPGCSRCAHTSATLPPTPLMSSSARAHLTSPSCSPSCASSTPTLTTLSELAREPATRRISLSGLAEAEVGAYISHAAKIEPDASAVAEIHAETDGNTLFVGEIVRLLVAEGRLGESHKCARDPVEHPRGDREPHAPIVGAEPEGPSGRFGTRSRVRAGFTRAHEPVVARSAARRARRGHG
jgi:hypothetical protein